MNKRQIINFIGKFALAIAAGVGFGFACGTAAHSQTTYPKVTQQIKNQWAPRWTSHNVDDTVFLSAKVYKNSKTTINNAGVVFFIQGYYQDSPRGRIFWQDLSSRQGKFVATDTGRVGFYARYQTAEGKFVKSAVTYIRINPRLNGPLCSYIAGHYNGVNPGCPRQQSIR